MNRFYLFATACSLCLCLTQTSHASTTYGPLEDFREHLDPLPTAQLRSTNHSSGGWDLKDAIKVIADVSGVDLRGAIYVTSQTPDLTGDLVFTTIYGLDPNPGSSALRIAGFDPLTPQVSSIFDERMIGDSGVEYLANVALTPSLSDLSGLLPGFDLSIFEGSPTSFFYLFQTTGPASDFTVVPEPSTWLLASIGAAVALTQICRRKQGG